MGREMEGRGSKEMWVRGGGGGGGNGEGGSGEKVWEEKETVKG